MKQLANLRRTKIPEDLGAFTSALSGFAQDAINRACEKIESSDVTKGEPAFPRLGRLLEECRREASTHHPRGELFYWTVSDYNICNAFDGFMKKEIQDHYKTEAQILTTYPKMARMWLAWKRQLRDGTLICPRWCDACDGVGWIISKGEDDENHATRCPSCRK